MLFLAHGAANKVAPAERIAGKITDYLHDLLLIYHASVSRAQYRAKQLGLVMNGCFVLLALDIARDLVHRTRAVKRNACDDVLKARWLHLLHKARHSGGFQLEHADRIAGTYQFEHTRVVIIAVLKIGRRSTAPADKIEAVAYDGEGSEA